MNQSGISYYDRSNGKICQETVLGDGMIRWAYGSLSGRCVAPLLFGNRVLSRLLGAYFDSRHSASRVLPTIEQLAIDSSEFRDAPESFVSFNDFFTRHLKPSARPYSTDSQDFLCPADGRVLLYPQVDSSTQVKVKGVDGELSGLFGQNAPCFSGGSVLVVRLCPADYHRYHFPCSGQVVARRRLGGQLHSVNPIALNAVPGVFCRNKRAITLIRSPQFGRVAFCEVGAFGVAAIHDTYAGDQVTRMQEKGYFAFGGSTVVIVCEPGAVDWDEDLLAQSRQGVETLVRVGETIGRATLPLRSPSCTRPSGAA